MKIFIYGVDYLCYSTSIANALQSMGHNVCYVPVANFEKKNLDLVQYLQYKLSPDKYKRDFIKKHTADLKENVNNFAPDIFISIGANYFLETVTADLLTDLRSGGVKLISWYIDSVKRYTSVNQHFDLFDEIISLEYGDVEYLLNNFQKHCRHVPMGVAEEIYCTELSKQNKEYDICFVGHGSENRVETLNAIAAYCNDVGKKLIVYGIYYNTSHWWKLVLDKFKFKKNYPNLYKCIRNETISPEQVVKLYAKSKICLNIHIPVHQNTNPRTFEILGSGNFELCDQRSDAETFGLKQNKNIVFYRDVEDAIKKIDYYLKHDNERQMIAENGSRLVRENCTMKRFIEKYASDIFVNTVLGGL